MDQNSPKRKLAFLFSIKLVIIMLIIFFGISGFIISYSHIAVSKKSNTMFVKKQFLTFFEGFKGYTSEYFNSGKLFLNLTVNTLIKNGIISNFNEEKLKDLLLSTIKNFPTLSSAYFADTKGNFYMAKLMPDKTVSIRKVIRGSNNVKVLWEHDTKDYYAFYPDQTFSLEKGYDPRVRGWYKTAKAKKGFIISQPYIFASDNLPGITFAEPLYINSAKGKTFAGVLAVDFGFYDITKRLNTTSSWSEFNGHYSFLLDNDYNVLSMSNINKPLFEEVIENGVKKLKLIKLNRIKSMPLYDIDFKHPLKYDDDTGITVKAILYLLNFVKKNFEFARDTYKSNSNANDPVQLNHVEYNGKNYLYAIDNISTLNNVNYKVGIIIPEKAVSGDSDLMLMIVVILSVILAAIIVLMGVLLSYSITKPLSDLSYEMFKIKSDFELLPAKNNKFYLKEINSLSKSFENMKQGLLSFKKYVPSKLVANLIKHGIQASVGGEKRVVTIFFSDIEGFTDISENMDPQKLTERLGEYFGMMTKVIHENDGTLDKFIGDATMAFWGAPVVDERHPLKACRSAMMCKKGIDELNKINEIQGLAEFKTRIGINTGEVLVGNIGSDARLNYTIIGDQVNLASRLEGVNKLYRTSIIIGESCYNEVQDHFEIRLLDKVSIRGRKQTLKIYELLAFKGELPANEAEFAVNYTNAVNTYIDGDFTKAKQYFDKCMQIKPDDPTTQMMIDRCIELINEKPDVWEGVFRFIR